MIKGCGEFVTNPLWIVVPVFDRQECIDNLIGCLEKQTFNNYYVIIVDHGEKDISIKSKNEIEVIKGSPKMWWASATNYGINYIIKNKQVDFKAPILILNDDVTFGPEYLAILINTWEGNDNVIIGSTCVGTGTKTILYANMILNKKKAIFDYKFKGADLHQISKEKLLPSDILTGRGTLIPARVFAEVGLYHEQLLPHYKADYELIYRAKRKGFHVYVSPSAIVYSKLDSPNQIDKDLESKRSVLFGRKSVDNIYDLFNYSYLSFNPIYGTYFFIINACRIIGKVLFFGTYIYNYYKAFIKS